MRVSDIKDLDADGNPKEFLGKPKVPTIEEFIENYLPEGEITTGFMSEHMRSIMGFHKGQVVCIIGNPSRGRSLFDQFTQSQNPEV